MVGWFLLYNKIFIEANYGVHWSKRPETGNIKLEELAREAIGWQTVIKSYQ